MRLPGRPPFLQAVGPRVSALQSTRLGRRNDWGTFERSCRATAKNEEISVPI